jgi:plastocyanin
MVQSLLILATALWLGVAAQPGRHAVSMSGFKFQPAVIHAVVGDTIVWQNHDIVPHTAHADDGSWDTGHMAAKEQRITVVLKRGSKEFTCLYHANMKGKLVVR